MHRDHILATVLFGATIAVAGAGVAYVVHNKQSHVPVDAEHCPQSPIGTVIAAIDQTDPRPQHEQQRISHALAAVAEAMQKHQRLALHVITGKAEDSATPAPLPDRPSGFSLCKPTDPKSVNPHIDNPRMAQQLYQREFLQPLMRAAGQLNRGGTATQSPILEAIEVMLWSRHFRADVPQRTLVLFSDMQQNTSVYSQLTGAKFDACQLLRSALGKRLADHDWTNVRVVIEYIRNPRDAERQGRDHLEAFWAALFYRLGAAQVLDGNNLINKPSGSCAPPPVAKPKSAATGNRKRS